MQKRHMVVKGTALRIYVLRRRFAFLRWGRNAAAGVLDWIGRLAKEAEKRAEESRGEQREHYWNIARINLNCVTKERLLKAHETPEQDPDLIVRVTGFSAFFASLSREYGQQVIDRFLD